MATRLLALKISPTDVSSLLKIIFENKGHRKIMEELTLNYYKKSSRQSNTPHLSPLRVRVAHSLRKLGLLTGMKESIQLTSEGEYLYSIIDDLNAFKRELSRIILQIDEKKCRILVFFNNKKSLRYNDIVNELKKENIIIKKNDDKLRRWLQFLTYCNIISFSSQGYTLDTDYLEALKTTRKKISLKKFESVLYGEYKILKNKKGSYASIPSLKSAVSSKLKNKGFTPFDFNDFLIDLIEDTPKKRIILSKTGVRQVGGIFYKKAYYHFLSIKAK